MYALAKPERIFTLQWQDIPEDPPQKDDRKDGPGQYRITGEQKQFRPFCLTHISDYKENEQRNGENHERIVPDRAR